MPREQISWEFSSDVCKHCEHAGCLEACPTGSIVRTEFGGVFVQPDVCNGCGYCVVGCPFGVIDRRPDDGRAFKCTFCYDRQKAGAAAGVRQGVPDAVDPVRRSRRDSRATRTRASMTLHARGIEDAACTTRVRPASAATHAIFIVRGDPRAYNLPPKPEVPTVYLRDAWRSAAVAAIAALAGTLAAFAATR